MVQSEDDSKSHVRGLPVHKAKHVIPLFGDPSVANPVYSEANQYQLRFQAGPNTRFQCLFIEKIFHSHSYDHCHLKCYQNKAMPGKGLFQEVTSYRRDWASPESEKGSDRDAPTQLRRRGPLTGAAPEGSGLLPLGH